MVRNRYSKTWIEPYGVLMIYQISICPKGIPIVLTSILVLAVIASRIASIFIDHSFAEVVVFPSC